MNTTAISFADKWQDYKQLVKFRLNLTVVFSTLVGYLIGIENHFSWSQFFYLLVGGFLTVGAANTINQIIERDSDRLMKRTENRPLAKGRMSIAEATIASLIMGIIGVLIISLNLNHTAGLLSLLSLCLYAFVYTPLKKVSPIAVYVGALPGALPVLIGYVAATGTFGIAAWVLFAIQVIWQFPHFYAIAWVLKDDYKRAGLRLQPLGSGKEKGAASQILIFTLLLLPLSVLPYLLGFGTLIGMTLLLIVSLYFGWMALNLYRKLENNFAKKLMFGSFAYLPIVFLIILIEKVVL